MYYVNNKLQLHMKKQKNEN